MNGRRVVIVMPLYNEARHLPRVLGSIAAQTFDPAQIYFVAVDGDSNDGSRQIVIQWLRESGMRGCVLKNVRRKIPISLNLGLTFANANDVVVRLDAHTIYGPTYIADAVRALETAPGNVGCVGCAHVPLPGSTFKERLVAALYTNPMGLGGADFRFGSNVREVDNIYLGVWRAEVLFEAGGFNERLAANEDAELSARIKRMGYRILRVPLPCRFLINRGPLGVIRQWHKYGYWRAKMLQRNPAFMRPRHVISLAAAIFVLGFALSPLRLALLPAFAAYGVLIVRYRAEGEAPAVTAASVFYFPVLQFAFAAGLLRGLVTPRIDPERSLLLAINAGSA
jgi:succinoglycan biosynthesis protein ExoA